MEKIIVKFLREGNQQDYSFAVDPFKVDAVIPTEFMFVCKIVLSSGYSFDIPTPIDETVLAIEQKKDEVTIRRGRELEAYLSCED